MYFCGEYDELTLQCLHWVDATEIFAVESGTGLKLGAMLLGLAVAAWCLRAVANMILNR